MLGAAVFGTDGPATGEHVRAYQRCGHTRLVAVGSRPGDAALAYAREAGAADAFVSKDFEGVLQHPDVELISITAAPAQRAEMAIRAARAGKHVCIEAPMARTLPDCRAVQAAVAEAGVRALVFFRLRAHPALVAAADLARRGAVGTTGYVAVNCWEGPEPDETAAVCHAVDALRWLKGRDNAVTEVFAYSGVLLCRFANGTVGRAGALPGGAAFDLFGLDVVGPEGAIRGDATTLRVWSRTLFPGKNDGSVVAADTPGDPLGAFAAAILAGGRAADPGNLDDAVQTHAIFFAARDSAATGQAVALPDGAS